MVYTRENSSSSFLHLSLILTIEIVKHTFCFISTRSILQGHRKRENELQILEH